MYTHFLQDHQLILTSEIDHGMFVLNVDLWSEDGHREVNLVRHSATSPSIGATQPLSYSELQSGQAAYADDQGPPGQMVVQGKKCSSNEFESRADHDCYSGGPGYNPFPGPPQVNPYTQHQGYGGGRYPPEYAPTSNGNPYPRNGYQGAQPPQPTYYDAAAIHASGRAPLPQAPQGAEYRPVSHPFPRTVF